jgi:hypothetical protein
MSSSKKNAAERIMALFSGNEGHYGTHAEPDLDPIGGVKWEIKRTARTLRGATTAEMWEKHLRGTRPLGIVPIKNDSTCVWGSIDIDDYDVNVTDVITKLEAAKLPLLPCRSKSGGLHLFMFLRAPAEAGLVQSTLRDIAASIGYAECEIFPKQTKLLVDKGDQGNWMVMPYCGTTYGGKLREQHGIKRTGAEMTLDEFLGAAERLRVDPAQLSLVRVKKPKKEKAPFSDGPPCLVHLAAAGIGQGGQNNTLFHMGVYFKRADPEHWKDRLEEANQKFCRPPHPAEKLTSVVRSLEKKEYQYKCKDQPMAAHCDAMACRGRKFGVGAGGTYPQITSISKLNTEPPIWFVDVEGCHMALSTHELQDYRLFHRACMDNTHKSFAVIAQSVWFGLLNEALQNVTITPAPEDVGTGGQFLETLETFLTNRQRGKEKDDLLSGRPWEDEEAGRHYFKLGALQKFLEREGMKELARHRGQITTRITKLGGGWQGLTHKSKGYRNYWWIPTEALNRPEEAATPQHEGDTI